MTNLEIWERDLKLLVEGDRTAWVCKRHPFARGWIYRVRHRTFGWALSHWSCAPATARQAWKVATAVAQQNLSPMPLEY